ncbi:MAG: hypothetical protein COT90_05260 [Candidatus Diapherotrites archaeon CG10_big_fil_rev_8_21_14_0_10_31_34]|nr:MAG: hypothetical protein COT90_05260 [Candidatus Diapherotrites archaeon CG10_big_fil_rev_8_21_14_0_10_31_34]
MHVKTLSPKKTLIPKVYPKAKFSKQQITVNTLMADKSLIDKRIKLFSDNLNKNVYNPAEKIMVQKKLKNLKKSKTAIIQALNNK